MDILQLQSIILTKTYTKADYLKRVTFIREYLEGKFFKNQKLNFQQYLIEINCPEYDKVALSRLDDHFFNLFTKDNVYIMVNGLMESLKSLPVLTLYLAIPFDNNLVDSLGFWFRQNLNPELIIDLRTNPALVTGCAYVWNNKYHDLSLSFLLNQNEKIIEKIIESYGQSQL